jgi:anti-sigma factor RsiW
LNDDPTRLDEWRDRMVAALYDELPESERRRLEAHLEEDPGLRREWDELREARRMLQTLGGDLPSGEVVPIGAPRVGGRAAVRRRWLLPAAAGFAAAATVFLGLLAAGLRVDRTGDGVLVRFGDGPAVAAAPTDQLVTRDELEMVAASLVEATAARMQQLESRQAGVQTELTRALYDALAVQQQRQYEDLRFRIERTAAQVDGWYPRPAAGALGDTLDQGGRHAID